MKRRITNISTLALVALVALGVVSPVGAVSARVAGSRLEQMDSQPGAWQTWVLESASQFRLLAPPDEVVLSVIVVGSLLESGVSPAQALEPTGEACAPLVDPFVPSPLRTTDYYVLRAAQLQQGCDRIIGPRFGEPYSVTNTDDSGHGSLRHAILSANVRPGLDTIVFAITSAPNGDGAYIIELETWLPPITEPVVMAATKHGPTPDNAPVIVIGGIQIGGD